QSIPRKMQRKEFSTTFQSDEKISLKTIQSTYQEVIKNLPFVRLPEKTIRKTLNIQSRITELRLLLEGMTEVSFKGITKEAEDNSDVIVSFIALLELVKLQEIELDQPTIFEDITISIG
ncbi:MAG: segregation/condensation protein A, partial [Candidatus Jacksonbacteria bacterium]|nr:segregation/condensation protein A [Candidatus Jacksonbacteria bacterium]MBT7008056.1 segregation/condensation protein A [Candidatus Jacksonbacteria bacterium]